MTSDPRMLAQLLTVSVLLLVETSADVLVQPGYHQPAALNGEHQRRQDSSQQLPQQYFQQQQQWQRQSSHPYQSLQAATNPADQTVSTSLISPFLFPLGGGGAGGIVPAGRVFSLGPLGLQTLRFGGLGGYGLPLLMSPHSQSHLAARNQFPRSTDRQFEDGVSGYETRNYTKSPGTWKNDDVASKSSVKHFGQSERSPVSSISQANNINERLVGTTGPIAGGSGSGKSDHEIVGGSLLDPLGLIEKTESAVENFGEHLPPIPNPMGLLHGMNSHSGLLAPPEPHLWRESDSSQVQQTQSASQNVPLGSPDNPKSETKQNALLGSIANATDSQVSSQHRESYRPTSYQSVLREPSSSNPVGSPAKEGNGNENLETEKQQRYRVDSSAWPYQRGTLGNPMTYQDGNPRRKTGAAQSWNPVGDGMNQPKGPGFANYHKNPLGRIDPTARRYPNVGAASPFYGNPTYGYKSNVNPNVGSPSRAGQNQQGRTAVNYPAGSSSYGSYYANIPADYASASQGRTIPLFNDYEYSRPTYGYGNNFLPGGWGRFGSSLSPLPSTQQGWLPRPYTFYNNDIFDDIADFSYRSYRPTF